MKRLLFSLIIAFIFLPNLKSSPSITIQEVDFDTNIAGYDSNVDKERHNHGYYFNIDKLVFLKKGIKSPPTVFFWF